jgi:hypothetical protein
VIRSAATLAITANDVAGTLALSAELLVLTSFLIRFVGQIVTAGRALGSACAGRWRIVVCVIVRCLGLIVAAARLAIRHDGLALSPSL